MRPSGRELNQMRPVSIETGILNHAEGSCLVSVGNTQVVCAASTGERVPFFRRNTGLGWVTAEYSMLPRATNVRNRRERNDGRVSGRTQEIQRLIGRSLRTCMDFAALGERLITIDCDVLNADGGTRCASITGAWVALRIAIDRLLQTERKVTTDPLVNQVAAVSCGLYAGVPVLDLDYAEDSAAEIDANFVMNSDRKWIEIQCTSEGSPFDSSTLTTFLETAEEGIAQLFRLQADAAASS